MSKISRRQGIKPFFRFLCASHELVCTLYNLFVAGVARLQLLDI
ncbi:MAG: hypothetical protein NTV29_16955 [Planctomycetota bacterium]|nr:hypothetical protein [Planctomycetota bacterium]